MVRPKVWVQLNSAEVRKILKGPGTTQLLKDLGEQVVQAGGSDYEVQEGSRQNRAVVNVIDPREGAMFRESQTGRLARALGSVSR